jgi:tetratricopeptide (TPR) repeat protein
MRVSSSSGPVQLSATLIVRNEERFLGDCLRSIRDVVDEIVVVDTGSTDRTPHIARNLGARLHHFPWRDDFSAARNHALDRARGEWILYIDADESLRPCDVGALRAQLSEPAHVAYNVLLYARPGLTPYWEMRLFRNDPAIRFRGVMHENIWPGIEAYRARRGGHVGKSPLVIDHRGYEGDQQPKHWRNLPLLARALREDPRRVFVLCHLANVCLAIGKERLAERAWDIALELVRDKRGRGLVPEDCLPYVSLIQRELAAGGDALALLTEAQARFPRNLQLRWLQGKALMQARQFDEAIRVFEQVLGAGDADYSTGYDTRLFGALSFEAVAACHFKLGRYDEAAQFFERAARCSPESLEYRVKRGLSLQLAGASVGRASLPPSA